MARIRSIKPEFFTSIALADLPIPVRLTFIGLWTYADDDGRGRDDARLVKAAVWPLDDNMASGDVREHLRRLSGASLICRYKEAGKAYFHVTHWTEHQRISHPAKSVIPPCPKDDHGGGNDPLDPVDQRKQEPSGNPPEDHRNSTGELPETLHASRARAEQGTGNREQGRDRTIVGLSDDDALSPPMVLQLVPPPAEARPALESPAIDSPLHRLGRLWKNERGKNGNTRFSPARRRAIADAHKAGYSDDDIADAIRGVALDPWQDRAQHDDLPVILHLGGRHKRNNLEFFRDLWRDGPPAPGMGKQTRQMADTFTAMQAHAPEEVNGELERVDPDRGQAQRELPRPTDRTPHSA